MAVPAPARTEISDTYPNPSNAVARTGFGKLWDFATNLLGTAGTPATARAALLIEARATVASHATTADIWTDTGHQINWTGTATCTALAAAPQAGAKRTLICAGAASFTAGANLLIAGYSSAATVTLAANDQLKVQAVTTTQFLLEIVRYNGEPAGLGSRATVASHATTAAIWDAAGRQIDWTGTATCTALPAAPKAGAVRTLICAAAAQFTASANMLIQGYASGATVTLAANDKVIIEALSTTQFLLEIVRYSGRSPARVTTIASTTTAPVDGDITDIYTITALAAACVFAAPTGTPIEGQLLEYRILDNGTARALSYNAIFVARGIALPTTTVLGKYTRLMFEYNAPAVKWDLIGVAQEA